ncbi:MAG: peptide deformylase [Flavobacteriales bacterium]|nr:peptide deformylase [Flavobacteriales bacterium]
MILPIYLYGDTILRKKCKDIEKSHQNLSELIENMFETMYNAQGVGLAAPQIGLDLRIFIVDASPMGEDEQFSDIQEELKDFKRVFINAKKINEEGESWKFTEGCLSIPDIRENVSRPEKITLEYYDENFEKKTETFTDIRARIVQHEYDHIEGILFLDYLSALKRKLLTKKLTKIAKGLANIDYKTKRK